MDDALLDRYREAGLYDPAAPNADDRRALLAFLTDDGCTLEEMVAADARGRLFALAGDRRLIPGRDALTLTELALEVDLDPTLVRRLWRAVGLTRAESDEPVAPAAAPDALRFMATLVRFLGEEPAIALARTVGSAMSRVGAAIDGVFVGDESLPLNLDQSGSEALTARAFAEVTDLAPMVAPLLDLLFRMHAEAAMRQTEEAEPGHEKHTLRAAVGFADLSEFTALSARLSAVELSQVVSVFEESAHDVVAQHGGRVVKFIGDAVMFLAARADQAAGIAADLVEHPRARYAGIGVRAGLAFGDVLPLDGDYFGSPVNLAARLVNMAEAGEILLGPGLGERLDTGVWSVHDRGPQRVRGLEAPVPVGLLRRR